MATDAGGAYAFGLASASPATPIATMNAPSPGGGDAFGRAVAIAGTRVAVGACQSYPYYGGQAGRVEVFDLASATPASPIAVLRAPVPQPDDSFGFAVAISGARVVVGEPYAYASSGAMWTGRLRVRSQRCHAHCAGRGLE